ncbi:MAG: ribulokinase [Planctomycetota bacterium]|nr:ribulokinase [Planctomycetota bacterium]
MPRVALGLDFGTESVRAILVDTANGRELGTGVVAFAHGVMSASLAGKKLPPEFALQHPQDYLDGLAQATKKAFASARVKPDAVVGIGVDFTACTVLPADARGEPLCFQKNFAKNPHAYVKLWKHHAAQEQADRVNALARQRGEGFLKRYGAGVSCEWLQPKLLETLERAPEVYAAAERVVEAGDWVIWQLTGTETRNACAAGYKACWAEGEGFPSEDFLAALNPGLRGLNAKLTGSEVQAAGARVGGLTAAWAKRLGLREGTPVGAAIIDAHAAVPACSLAQPGELAIILGTSFCHMLLGAPDAPAVSGVAGSVKEGILPGLMGYEAGQAGGGDLWAWCVRELSGDAIRSEAKKKKSSEHAVMASRAAKYAPGGTGLIALDWLNGNRSPLNRPDLSGALVGLTLSTPPEAIYRALQEALAFGTRVIVENFEAQGLPVTRIVTSGGIAEKDPAFLQILADVCAREIEVARSGQACAVGAAILGAVAAGAKGGGHDGFASAAKAMGGVRKKTFTPLKEAARAYSDLFSEYKTLADYFGKGGNEVMRRLRKT